EAGRGWQEGLVGTADVPTGSDSQAGYTLRASEPVLVDDLREETRFSGPALLTDHGVASGLSTVIWAGQKPWGVFGTHSAERRAFSEQDVSFVQAIANLLGEAAARRHTEAALRDAKERFEGVAETVPDIIFNADPSVQVTYLNQRWTEWTGAPAAAGLGSNWSAYLHESDRDRVAEKWARVREDGTFYEDRQRLRTADGTYRWVIVRARPVRQDGEIVRWLGTVTDIDDLVHAEQTVKALNETLEGRVRERTEQVRALASALTLAEQHERRRIAQILHDDLQQMLYGLELTTQQVRRAETEAVRTRFLDQFNEILDRAIDTTRTLTVELSPPVLRGEGLEDALRWLAVHMERIHGLTVEVAADEQILIESEDLRVLLFQLIRELLFNVVKHAGVDHARITAAVKEESIMIGIEDDGVGFDPAALEGNNRPDDGFGLVSVRERLRLFGGRLDIESTPGEGTCMTIVTPLLPHSG
ncbi:MAG: PAS domain S-box protein, partial [Rhodothermales bacterium]|nr:PAS domain S-box protein [Rhodothermales bacterium]